MARRATIQDLAATAGVGVSTIDRILNGRNKVRAATAERVLSAAAEPQFYALPTLRERLQVDKPPARLGFLLQQSHRTFYCLIADWKAFIKDDKRLTNDPMEAHCIGFNMWVQAVTAAGTIEVDPVPGDAWTGFLP